MLSAVFACLSLGARISLNNPLKATYAPLSLSLSLSLGKKREAYRLSLAA